MENKIWIEKHIYTHCEQIVIIQPNEEREGVVLAIKEIDGDEGVRLYLNKKEIDKICKELKSSSEEYCI